MREKIKGMLETLGIPVAYRVFKAYRGKPLPDPPFIVFAISPVGVLGSDDKNLAVRYRVLVELYTAEPDTTYSSGIEALLSDCDWEGDEDYMDSEKLYVKSYEYEIIK